MQARLIWKVSPFPMLLSVLLLFVQPLVAAELGRNQSDELEAVLTEKSLQIHGAPSAQVAYLGASLHEERQSWARVETYSGILTDDDADGQLEFAPEAGISVASVWIVVDLASGTVLEVTPTGFVKQLPKEAEIRAVENGRSVLADRADLEFLLYRAGVGVWFGKGLDGGEGDSSLHADGTVRVQLGAFRALRNGNPAPSALRPGDLLLAIDLNNLDAISVAFQ